ncbi:WD repeat and FYVE domain-containing protein 2 [Lamellibrachia satsuma]|nr:WD repeat and FYVE domain-containing protein 2 [Lamellibrachia satsuma]
MTASQAKMAAEIQTERVTETAQVGGVRKPQLLNKLEGCSDTVNMAVIIAGEDGVISVSDDRTVRVWLKRDSGQYWPSICHYMSCAASSLYFSVENRHLYVGLDNGTITEFQLTDDYNRLIPVRDYLAHRMRVTAVMFTASHDWVLSCGRDKYFQWHCSETGRRLGGYQTSGWCTSLQFDSQSRYVFIGDYSGEISMLVINETSFKLITTLKGHSGSVRCLAWDEQKRFLFSGSFDQSLIMWDIGEWKGTVYELQGHHNKIQAVAFASLSKQLVSTCDDRVVAFWDMDVKRQETPVWTEGDSCQACNSPFFWNMKSMWECKTIGVRQHHCRKCGKAVCAKCSCGETTIPQMGYEYAVRVCDSCLESITEEDRAPLATFHDIKHQVISLDLDEPRKLMLTVGRDRVIKVRALVIFSVFCHLLHLP